MQTGDRQRAGAPDRGYEAANCHLRDAAHHLGFAASVGAGRGGRTCRTPVRLEHMRRSTAWRTTLFAWWLHTGNFPVHIQAREGFPINRDRVIGRTICDRRSVHVHDLAAEDSEYPSGSSDAKRLGHRTTLGTPLLRERTPIGGILFRRFEVRPFSDNQIALLESFADQAAIAIENVRLFEAEKQRTLALAQANRDLAEREAKIRRLVEANIIGISSSGISMARSIEANDAFLRMIGYDREDLLAGRIALDGSDPSGIARAKRTDTLKS